MNRRASDDSHATPSGRGDSGPTRTLEEEKEAARETAREAAAAGKERLEAGAGQAAERVDDIAQAVGTAASRLSELEHEGLADYANRLASYLGDMSERLRSKNVDEITADIRHLAERNPAVFVLGSVALGLGLSRFAKASGERRNLDGAAGEAEWTEDVATEEFEPYEPRGTYESRDRGASDEAADRPATPDSSGGGGL